MLLMLFMLVVWILPAQAGDQYRDAGNRKYADTSASNGRRYPPRNNKNQEQPDYADKRTDSRNRKGREYDRRNSSGRYSEGETVTEQRQYYGGKRPAYSSGSQRKEKFSDNRTGKGGNRNTSLDDAASWARGQSRGRVISPSSEPRRKEKFSDNRTGKGGNRNTSLDDAVSWARRQSRGRVLSAETVQKNNQEEHRVRIITDGGRVRRYRMDALTGNLLPKKP